MFQCNAFQLDAFQNDCRVGTGFQCDAFQLDAFQNDCEDLPEDLTARRRRTTLIVRLPGARVTTPLEEWEREKEPGVQVLTEHDLQRALAEDEELLLGLWD